jgi:hypothetical protein
LSARRWHNELDVAQAGDVDAELIAWLREAYEIGAQAG